MMIFKNLLLSMKIIYRLIKNIRDYFKKEKIKKKG